MTKAILIYNARLLDEAMDAPGALLLLDGKIRSVFQGYFTTAETVEKMANAVIAEDGLADIARLELYNARGLTLTPAFIDMHVHMRYPGQTQKEDLNSGLHAAASGGFGTVVAMPNTTPVVSSIDMSMKIEREAATIGLTHLFQTVSITKDFGGVDTNHLVELDKKYVPVISEDGRDVLASSVMLEGMEIAGEKGIIVACHCEDPTLAKEAAPFRQEALQYMKDVGLSAWGTSQGFDYEDKKNADVIKLISDSLTQANNLLALAEDVATVRNIMLAKQAKCHIHICHVSTKNAIDAIRQAKIDSNGNSGNSENSGNFGISCEVTPHHLALCGDKEPYIRALVNPPLRPESDRQALIEALRDGTVDVISTDHAPHTLADKAGGSPGFTGEETAFAVCNTVLVKNNSFNPKRLSQLMSGNPGRLLGLQKGLLRSGYDADLTLVDPDEEWTVDSKLFYSKGKASPFDGQKLTGRVRALFIDGRLVLEK